MKRMSRLLVVLVVIIINTLLVARYAGQKHDLPSLLESLLNFIDWQNAAPEVAKTKPPEVTQPEDPIIPEPVVPNLQPTKKVTKSTLKRTRKPRVGELARGRLTCDKGKYGETTEPDKLYRWVDEDGEVNLTNKRPNVSVHTPVKVVGTYPREQFKLRVLGDELDDGFKTELSQRVGEVLWHFGQVLDMSTVQDLDLTFRYFNQFKDYDDYRVKMAPGAVSNTGFYSSGLKESVIYIRNPKQGIRTSAHEATHAINNALFGNIARWLNEGLAVIFSRGKGDPLQSSKPYIDPLSKLFSATEEEWDGEQREALYNTSEAFVGYLLATNKEALARLLLEEQYNGCNTLTGADVERIVRTSFN